MNTLLSGSFIFGQATMLWRVERMTALATEFPDVLLSHMHVENATMLVHDLKQVLLNSQYLEFPHLRSYLIMDLLIYFSEGILTLAVQYDLAYFLLN